MIWQKLMALKHPIKKIQKTSLLYKMYMKKKYMNHNELTRCKLNSVPQEQQVQEHKTVNVTRSKKSTNYNTVYQDWSTRNPNTRLNLNAKT